MPETRDGLDRMPEQVAVVDAGALARSCRIASRSSGSTSVYTATAGLARARLSLLQIGDRLDARMADLAERLIRNCASNARTSLAAVSRSRPRSRAARTGVAVTDASSTALGPSRGGTSPVPVLTFFNRSASRTGTYAAGRCPSSTCTVTVSPPRSTRTDTVSPGSAAPTGPDVAVIVDRLPVDCLDVVARLEACAVGRAVLDDFADHGVFAELDAEVSVLHLAAFEQLADDFLDRVDRNGAADAGCRCRLRSESSPPRPAPPVEQRAAGVALVERRVRLDRAADPEAVGRLDVAVERADDARRERALEPEGAAGSPQPHRRPRVSPPSRAAGASALRLPSSLSSAMSVDGSLPTIRACAFVAVGEAHETLVALDDVVVRDDAALLVDDESRSSGAPPAAPRTHRCLVLASRSRRRLVRRGGRAPPASGRSTPC